MKNTGKHSPGALANPLKRCFEMMDSNPSSSSDPDAMEVDIDIDIAPGNFRPREYQLKVFQVAIRQNTIVVLNTGPSKTMIAIMIIKHIASSCNLHPKKLILFLAPTDHLVHQQFQVIKVHTNLQVQEYYGAKGVDEWNVKFWEKEVNEHDVLIMTPQILLDALRKAFLSFEIVCLMIIDECHHATGNHPYAKIMKEFYHKSGNKPKIFGMTASTIIGKGVSSPMDCKGQISELESILDSQIYTMDDKVELEEVIPCAKEIYKFYDPEVSLNLDLKANLESSLQKYEALLLELQGSMLSDYGYTDDKYKALQRRLSNDHAKIVYCLDNLGLICAYEAIQVCLENAPYVTEECEVYRRSSLQCKYFLEDALSIMRASLPHGSESLSDIGSDGLKAKAAGYITPKFFELLQIFQSFGEARQVLCLIFVERIIAAKVIEKVIKQLSFLSDFTVAYLTGSNSSDDALAPKVQKEIMESFCSGKVNLLFATDVVEKGIHVPNCSSVIHFDLPKTVRGYVQSRGWARQHESQFIMMLERGNIKQREQVFYIIRSEHSMTETTISQEPSTSILRASSIEETYVYYVDATGASVTTDSSVSLIHRYCEKLPGDKYFTPKPMFQFVLLGDSYQCTLTLPPNAAFQSITGPPSRNSHLSKQLACFVACKKLHQMGALNNHLLPFDEASSENDSSSKIRGSTSGAGTTKRKELHGTVCIRALSGKWGSKHEGTTFHAYNIHFSCNIPDVHYSSFVLLIESQLDDDVGNIEMELYLVSKFVKSSVAKAMCFQQFFFNGLFGKLFIRLKSSGERKFLLQAEEEPLWNPSNMYLLLPLGPSGVPSDKSWTINWMGINSCVSAVKFLKKNAWLSIDQSNSGRGNSSPHKMNSIEADCNNTNVIHLANKSVAIDNLREMVVLAIHTGRIYSVLHVIEGTSAESPFDGNSDVFPSSYSSFADYFNKKYGIILMHPGQPLLLLKQSHNAHNLLVDFKKGASSRTNLDASNKVGVQRQQSHVHMPPELLVSIDVQINILKSFYLLPSLMHRLESLMLASQLKEEITDLPIDFKVSSSLILEAITTLRCNESFSMERLELLGDSVLKYAVSCHLFLKYPKKHEGQLSAWRSWAVCNSTLHKLGTDRNLQGYIRDGAFDPRRWIAPGQCPIRAYPCSCGVDTLEVPLKSKFQTEDAKVVIGKCCDKGHRWMGSKTISDCVEALIGAYYVGGGLIAALHLMKWLGIDATLDPSLVNEAITAAAFHSYIPKNDEIEALESKLGYEFSVKGLLLEAITHASEQEQEVGYCYQRLEFLGDSVLDILITWHLYKSHKEIDPGELTDLRSASVNNEKFAQASVKHNLHQHLQHCSGFLLSQITGYVNSVSGSDISVKSLQGVKGPKALGDMVESVAGAILIDSKLNLDEVWRIFKPILSPIVTPDKLELPPLRELIELCDSLGYFLKENCIKKGEIVHAELRLQLKDVLLVGEGFGQNRKAAKGQAALHLLKELESRGILYSKRRKQGPEGVDMQLSPGMGTDICSQTNANASKQVTQKKLRIAATQLHAKSNKNPTSMDHATLSPDSKLKIPENPYCKSFYFFALPTSANNEEHSSLYLFLPSCSSDYSRRSMMPLFMRLSFLQQKALRHKTSLKAFNGAIKKNFDCMNTFMPHSRLIKRKRNQVPHTIQMKCTHLIIHGSFPTGMQEGIMERSGKRESKVEIKGEKDGDGCS
ncbi:Ribonuclease III [Bertholletia excelsa]